jgi:hypothetical protein
MYKKDESWTIVSIFKTCLGLFIPRCMIELKPPSPSHTLMQDRFIVNCFKIRVVEYGELGTYKF